MEGIVTFIAALMIIGYLVLAIWVVWTRKSMSASIGAAVGFFAGGIVIVQLATVVATIIVIFGVIAFIGALLGGS